MNRFSLTILTLAATLVVSTGCSTWSKDSKVAKTLDPTRLMWWKERKPEPQIPSRLVSSWTDTVLHRAGQKSQRGFGGRISFFGRASEDPIRVNGQLVVYAYDESKGDPKHVQPTRRYVFPRDQFERMESESALGASYSVWLPWDEELAGPRKNISLIPRFEPVGGPLLVGEQTRHLLPGAKLENDTPLDAPVAEGIQLTQHTAPEAETSALPLTPEQGAKPEMISQSLRLPETWRNRLTTSTTVEDFRARHAAQVTQHPGPTERLFPLSSARLRTDRLSDDSPLGKRPAASRPSLR